MFVSVFNFSSGPLYQYPIVWLLASLFCFWKLKRHKNMLDQMAAFDLRNAKCTLESDRRVFEEQVLSLWDEALEPPVSVAFGA